METLKCPNCSNDIPANSSSCRYCGLVIDEEIKANAKLEKEKAPEPADRVEGAKKGSKWILWVVILLAAVAAVVVLQV